MNRKWSEISLVSVALNVLLALALSPFASKKEISPPKPGGAAALSFKSQIMHMLVHHGQVLFTSSLIVFALTYLFLMIHDKYFKTKN